MDAAVVQAVNHLTSRWVRELPSGTNTVVSGLGLWPLLALLATAADEPGRSELSAAAGVDAETAGSRAVELIAAIDGASDLHAALGVWVHDQLKLSESFDSVLPASLTGRLTGDLPRDKARLDAWASDHTDGLIQQLPLEVTPDLAVVLASALSLRTTWVRPFTEKVVRPNGGPWAGGHWHWLERIDRDLDPIRRYDDPAAGALSVITVRGDADVDVLLGVGAPRAQQADVLAGLVAAAAQPDAGRPGGQLVRAGQPGDEVGPALRIATTESPAPDLRLSLPSFAVEVEHDLMRQPQLFGLATVSSDPGGNGHFSGISPQPLAVAQARQTVLARFFSTGFEAAAVTAMGMVMTSFPTRRQPRIDVELNRPFGFVAVHRESRLPVVTGWIATPTHPA